MFGMSKPSLETPKHIAVIGAKGFPDFDDAGGVEQGVMEVTTRLAELGYKPIVYERGRNFSVCERYGVKLQTAPFFDSQNFAGWSHAFLSFFHASFRIRNLSVCHIHCAQNGSICLFARLIGRRVVFHLHGREWRAKKWNWLMRHIIFFNCILGVVSSHSVLAVCHTSMNDLYKWLPFCRRKIHFVPNGVPETPNDNYKKNMPTLNPTRPFLLYAGRIVPQKNLTLLLNAFSRLPVDMSLVIAGGASYCSSYVSRIQTACVADDRVQLTGRLSRRELWDLYRTCVALILPSATEGCSNVLLEGMAAGCCIVASDIPENQLVLGDAALYFKANNKESLREVLCRICKQSESLGKFKTAALDRGRQLPNWDTVTNHIIKLYET